jgi:hypothetical protein
VRRALLEYNLRDIKALQALWPRLLPRLDLDRARLRGRYMLEVFRMEHNGVPINQQELQTLADHSDNHSGTMNESEWSELLTAMTTPER